LTYHRLAFCTRFIPREICSRVKCSKSEPAF
jgi:hypothetical protein